MLALVSGSCSWRTMRHRFGGGRESARELGLPRLDMKKGGKSKRLIEGCRFSSSVCDRDYQRGGRGEEEREIQIEEKIYFVGS